jgi:uncharacterized protein with HEPN domain
MSPEAERDWRLYAEDERTQDAVIRNVEIVGEAAKHIPDEVAARAPEIAWRNVRGMRDILAHGYFGTSLEIVWAMSTLTLADGAARGPEHER